MTKKIWIKAPRSMIEGYRVWVQDGEKRRELSQVNGDGHGAAFYSAFDSEAKAIAAAQRFYRVGA